MKRIIIFVFIISNLLQGTENWEHILSNIEYAEPERRLGTLYDTNDEISGRLYYSPVTYQFRGANSNGNIDSNERIRLNVGGVVTDNYVSADDEGYINVSDLENWANTNADKLQNAVFGSNPIAAVTGTTASISNMSNSILLQTSKGRNKKNTTKSNMLDSDFSTIVVMDSEKASLVNNGISGRSSAFKFSYDTELNSGNDIGFLFAYKKNKASDSLNSKSKSYLLSPYYKYYYTLNDDIEFIGVANLVGSLKDMTSTLFPEGFQYLEYGAGLSIIPNYYVNDKLLFRFPLGFQSIKKHIQNKVPSDIEFIIKAINNIGFQTSINYGISAEYAIKPTWIVSANLLQTKLVNESSNRKLATYYNLNTTYYTKLFSYVLGYKTVKDVSNYTENAYMVSVQYNW